MIRTLSLLLGAVLAIVVLLLALDVGLQPRASRGWQEFSIGPAAGINSQVSPAAIHSEGMDLRWLLSIAYDIPRTRIIGPGWLAVDRYAITAVTAPDGAGSLRGLLQQELTRRLALTAHVEERDFEVFVLSAARGARSLERTAGRETSIHVQELSLHARDTAMVDLANVLQSVLGKPVADETGIRGNFNIELAWGENRERTITEALQNRLDLQLKPGRRRLPALIVDRADRGAALAALAQVGRMSSGLPGSWRHRLSRAMAVH